MKITPTGAELGARFSFPLTGVRPVAKEQTVTLKLTKEEAEALLSLGVNPRQNPDDLRRAEAANAALDRLKRAFATVWPSSVVSDSVKNT